MDIGDKVYFKGYPRYVEYTIVGTLGDPIYAVQLEHPIFKYTTNMINIGELALTSVLTGVKELDEVLSGGFKKENISKIVRKR